MGGDPQRCRLLRRSTIILGLFLFEPPHPGGRRARQGLDSAKPHRYLDVSRTPGCRKSPVGCPIGFRSRYCFYSSWLTLSAQPFLSLVGARRRFVFSKKRGTWKPLVNAAGSRGEKTKRMISSYCSIRRIAGCRRLTGPRSS